MLEEPHVDRVQYVVVHHTRTQWNRRYTWRGGRDSLLALVVLIIVSDTPYHSEFEHLPYLFISSIVLRAKSEISRCIKCDVVLTFA